MAPLSPLVTAGSDTLMLLYFSASWTDYYVVGEPYSIAISLVLIGWHHISLSRLAGLRGFKLIAMVSQELNMVHNNTKTSPTLTYKTAASPASHTPQIAKGQNIRNPLRAGK